MSPAHDVGNALRVPDVVSSNNPAPADESAPAEDGPSSIRAWWALVALSLRRQARARQMVWIALSLLAFAVIWVAVNTAWGRWGMSHWRFPRGRGGMTYVEWNYRTQMIMGLVHHSPGAHAVQNAVFGSCGVILSPNGTNDRGEPLGIAAFQVFSQSVVFSIFLSFLLPLWSLSFATESLGGERESQSLIWLLSRPLSRPGIYLAKFVALLPWSVGLNIGGFALLCLAAGPQGRMALSLYWPAVTCATLAFAALFFLFGAYFRRPAVVAIVYSFCLEVVLGNMPGYMKRVSVGFYTRCLMYEQVENYGIQPDRPGVFLPVDGITAALVLVGSALALLGLGMWLFSRTQYHDLD